MNKFPTTILTVAGRPVLLKRAYSGNASAYECTERRIGAAVSYTPGRRLARFPDVADVLAALEREDADTTLPAYNKPVTLSRVIVTLAALPAGGLWNQELLRAEISRAARAKGYVVETLELREGEPGVLAYRGAALDLLATVEMCRIAAKCKPAAGAVTGGVQ